MREPEPFDSERARSGLTAISGPSPARPPAAQARRMPDPRRGRGIRARFVLPNGAAYEGQFEDQVDRVCAGAPQLAVRSIHVADVRHQMMDAAWSDWLVHCTGRPEGAGSSTTARPRRDCSPVRAALPLCRRLLVTNEGYAGPMTGERELVACLQKSASNFCRCRMVVGCRYQPSVTSSREDRIKRPPFWQPDDRVPPLPRSSCAGRSRLPAESPRCCPRFVRQSGKPARCRR